VAVAAVDAAAVAAAEAAGRPYLISLSPLAGRGSG